MAKLFRVNTLDLSGVPITINPNDVTNFLRHDGSFSPVVLPSQTGIFLTTGVTSIAVTGMTLVGNIGFAVSGSPFDLVIGTSGNNIIIGYQSGYDFDLLSNQTVGGIKNFTGTLQWMGNTPVTGNTGAFASTVNLTASGAFLQSEINQFSGIVVNTTGQFVNTTDSRNLQFTKVGIGQSPSAPLDVLGIVHINAALGTTFTQGTPALDLFGTTGQYRIGFDSISSSVGYIRYNIVAGGLANTWGHCFSTSQIGTPNTFSNNLFIGATGAVGIRTVNPAYALDVNGAIKTNNQIISTLSIGTQPLNVTSTTMCTNLNANYVGGIALAGLVQSITDGVTTLHGNITMSGSGGITVSIAGQIISITYTSDRRAKRKIKKYKNGAYRLIKKIPIKQWEYNGKAGTNKGEIGIGFIAQEVKDILPHCVGTHKAKLNPKDKKISDVYHLNMPNLVGVLTKAVQELMDDNEKLTTRVEELETKCKKHFLHHKPHAQ